jgi:hypothetical protein
MAALPMSMPHTRSRYNGSSVTSSTCVPLPGPPAPGGASLGSGTARDTSKSSGTSRSSRTAAGSRDPPAMTSKVCPMASAASAASRGWAAPTAFSGNGLPCPSNQNRLSSSRSRSRVGGADRVAGEVQRARRRAGSATGSPVTPARPRYLWIRPRRAGSFPRSAGRSSLPPRSGTMVIHQSSPTRSCREQSSTTRLPGQCRSQRL